MKLQDIYIFKKWKKKKKKQQINHNVSGLRWIWQLVLEITESNSNFGVIHILVKENTSDMIHLDYAQKRKPDPEINSALKVFDKFPS